HVLAGPQGVFLEEVVRISAGGRLALVCIVPRVESGGMRHQYDIRPPQGNHPRKLRELVVITDDDADLSRTAVEASYFTPALVIKRLISREVQLALLADVALWTYQNLGVVNNVMLLLAQAGAEHRAVSSADIHEASYARALGHRLGELPGLRRAVT